MPFQVIQRTGTTGDIEISGEVSSLCDVRARFNGGAWVTLAEDITGAFTGTLSAQAQGQGSLEIQTSTDGVNWSLSYAVTTVGIGDVFAVIGQSNAVGLSPAEDYTHATLKAAKFGNDYLWSNLTNPVDDPTNQVDTVSQDASGGGSIWTRIATQYLADIGIPCAFVPCAKVSTSIVAWQPGANRQDRTTLYGSAVYRALTVGGVKAVLMWQGEADAGNLTEAEYLAYLETLGDAIATDLSAPLVVGTLHNYNSSSGLWQAIVDAQMAAWGTHNIVAGADISDIVDTLHPSNSANVQEIADRWWTALQTAFYT